MLSSKVAVLGAATILALPLSAASISANAQSAPHARAGASAATKVGKVTTLSTHRVVLRSLPHNGPSARAQRGGGPTLGRDGKPAGAALPSRPSTGQKPGATTSSASGPLALTNAFDGVSLPNASCGCQPPDVNATVGPNHIVEAVNLSLAVYSKSGTQLQNTGLNTFLGTADGLSDPRVLYDTSWNRYVMVLTDVTARPTLWLAVSAGPDPTGGWIIYHFGFSGFPANTLIDYPMIGMDQDALFITSNNYDGSDSYINSTAFAIPKARVYNALGWGAGLFAVAFGTAPSIVNGYPIQQTNTAYMLAADDANNLMYVYYWTNSANVASLHYKGAIAYTWGAPPRRVNQPGTSQTLDPLDGRLVWANSQLDGRIWFAHGVAIGSFPGVNYGFVNPGPMTITTSTAFHSATSDDFNPAIAAMKDGSGKLREVVTWAYTDTANNVPTSDAYSFHGGIALAHLTGAKYGGGSSTNEFRFGDYASAVPEYNAVGTCGIGQSALVANEYFAADGTWKTRIARVNSGC